MRRKVSVPFAEKHVRLIPYGFRKSSRKVRKKEQHFYLKNKEPHCRDKGKLRHLGIQKYQSARSLIPTYRSPCRISHHRRMCSHAPYATDNETKLNSKCFPVNAITRVISERISKNCSLYLVIFTGFNFKMDECPTKLGSRM